MARAGTTRAQAAKDGAAQDQDEGARDRTTFVRTIQPRLLNLEEAAQYLGLSFWSFRELVNAGQVPLVRVPRPRTMRQHKRAARSAVLRRTLVDVRSLDDLVDRWREAAVEVTD